MGKYLDKTGLQYFYGKLKEKFADKTTIENKLDSLTGALTWKGKFDTLPAVTDYKAGNVVGVGNKEYVLTVTGSTKAWEELGDEGSYLLKSVAEETYLKKAAGEVATANIADGAVISAKLATGARKSIILTPDTTEVDEETYQKLLSDDVDVVFKALNEIIYPLYSKEQQAHSNHLILIFAFPVCLTGPQTEITNDVNYTVRILPTGNHSVIITENKVTRLSTYLAANGYVTGDVVYKNKLSKVLQNINLTGTDADRKAKLDQFAKDWKVLTGANDLNGARFVGNVSMNDGATTNVLLSMDQDNNYSGISMSDDVNESQLKKIVVHPNNGSVESIPLFSHLEAITISIDNTSESKAANVAAIKAYADNLIGLGVDTTKGYIIPITASGRNGFLSTRSGNYPYAGYVAADSSVSDFYNVLILGNGEYYDSKIQSENSSELNTISKKLVPAINEVNTLAKNKQDKLTSGTNIKTINNQSILGSGNINITGGVTKCKINVNTLVAEPTGNEPLIFKMPLSDVQKYKNYDVVEIYLAENGVETPMYTVYHGALNEFYATSNGTGWLTGMFIGDETTTDENKIGFELIMSETADTVDKNAREPISSRAVYTALQGKQDTLTSGTNIKTINNQSLLGSGNIKISAPSITVDTTMSDTSTNPVQNKVIKAYIDGLVGNATAWIEYE